MYFGRSYNVELLEFKRDSVLREKFGNAGVPSFCICLSRHWFKNLFNFLVNWVVLYIFVSTVVFALETKLISTQFINGYSKCKHICQFYGKCDYRWGVKIALWTVRDSYPSRGKRFFFPPSLKRKDRLQGLPSHLLNGYRRSFPGVKRPRRNVHHSPPTSAEVKNAWSCTSTPPVYLHGVDRENFTCL
jgi:hypothetical protein